MAEELPKGIHLPEHCIPYVTPDSIENMNCLICDTDLVTFSGYHVLYTVIGSTGSLLCDGINKVLRRGLEVVTARSTIVCKRCYFLFEELDATENKCAFIRKEIESIYMKTCEVYNDAPPYSVPGVACQTENNDLENTQLSESSSDLKLKISLTSKRRRGRPAKVPQINQDVSNENIEFVSEVQENEDYKVKKLKDEYEKKEVAVSYDSEDTVQLRRTRSTTKNNTKKKNLGIVETEKENTFEEKIEAPVIADVELEYNIGMKEEIKTDPEPQNREHCSPNVVNEKQSDGADYNDDFEWKEEPPIGMVNDSSENDDDKEEKSGDQNEDGWQSGSSKDGNSKQKKKKKKKKPGDRKGERAFMVPVHECDQCGKKWRTVTELKSHVASHSDIRPYVCEICGQAYKMKKALDIHIGMHNGIHPFVCEYCNKSFTQKVGLEKHLPIHTGVTRFQCDLCGKRFIHQKSFNIHKMTHTGEKNIRCPICQLAVFSQSHLKRHYRVHTGERPYECTVCGKKFAEKYNLNAHAKIHDPNSAGEGRRRCHSCPVCGMTYDRKHKLADHLSTVHGMWQSASAEFKSENFYNVDVQTMENQHPLLPLQVQEPNLAQPPEIQSIPQQPLTHSQQVLQSQPPQLSAPQPPSQAQQAPLQMSQTHQSPQPHHIIHSSLQQQHSPLHLQAQVQSSASPHHILLTQHQIQQTLQNHLSHHPTATVSDINVAHATSSTLQPISSVFHLVSVPSDTVAVHHNRMNSISSSMPVPSL